MVGASVGTRAGVFDGAGSYGTLGSGGGCVGGSAGCSFEDLG